MTSVRKDENLDYTFDSIIGRDLELESLKRILDKVISSQELNETEHETQVVLISGPTGVGKTTLAKSLQHFVSQAEEGGFFIGKFDQLTQLLNPSSACTHAIDSILVGVYEDGRGAELLRAINNDLAEGISEMEELDRLTSVFPTFAKIVEENGLQPGTRTPDKVDASGQKLLVSSNAATGMLKESLRLLRRGISRLYNVTVVLFDDIHWADESMLDVFGALTEDSTSVSTLFVGTYRENHIGPALLRFLNTLRCSRSVSLTEIHLQGIAKSEYATLACDTIGIAGAGYDHPKYQELVDVLYQRTSGYVFYTQEFLHVLLSSGTIHLEKGKLSCDITAVKENFGSALEDILVYKLSKLPEEVLQLLRMSSCIGSRINEDILELLLRLSRENVRALLLDALEHGIVVRRTAQNGNCFIWSFSHDAFKEAIYNIMSETDRAQLHYEIGVRLSEGWTTFEAKDLLFLVTSQMLLGTAAIPKNSEVFVAQLCLRSGERATQSSSFWTARDFLVRGIELLERGSSWDEEYNLFLQLYCAAAEVSYCTGRLNEAHFYADVVLHKASCQQDTDRAHAVKLYTFGGCFEFDKAIEHGFSLLRRFGVRIPKRKSLVRIWCTVHLLKRRIKRAGIKALCQMETMRNPDLLSAMHILNILFLYCFLDDFELGIVVGATMVDLTLKHGGGPFAFVGFGLLGAVFCNPRFDDADFGYELGETASALYDKFSSKTWYARKIVINVVGSVVSKKPVPSTFETLERAYRVGLCYGDVELAMACGSTLCFSKLEYRSLPEVDKLIGEHHELLLLYNQHGLGALLQPLWQFIKCLRGSPSVYKGTLLGTNELNRKERKGGRVSLYAHTHSMLLHFLFSDYEAAYESSKHARESISNSMGANDLAYCTWCFALLCIVVARSTHSLVQRMSLRRRALKLLQMISKLALHNPHLFLCRQFLVEAEYNIHKRHQAHSNFVAAIAQAHNCGSLLMIAVINERAARFYADRNDISNAKLCFGEALKYYDLWGAIAKSQHLRQELSTQNF